MYAKLFPSPRMGLEEGPLLLSFVVNKTNRIREHFEHMVIAPPAGNGKDAADDRLGPIDPDPV